MWLLRIPVWVRSSMKKVGLIAFGGYILWNATWLLQGSLPPSILKSITGLPCPTTGMTRSVLSLMNGDIWSFFLYNPFTTVYIVLAGISVIFLLSRFLQKQEFLLPKALEWGWCFFLFSGLVLKFALGKNYW